VSRPVGALLRLRVGPTSRYLVDADGSPFLIHGDTAWSLVVSVDEAGARHYLDDRAGRHFNSVIVNLIEHVFAPDPPRTIDGHEPFNVPGDLRTPNDAYFDHVDQILELAAQRGIVLFLAPAYLGYPDPHYPGFEGQAEGWFDELLHNGVDRCRAYGEYLGQRYGSTPNIVWVMAGDRRPAQAVEHVRAIAAGIRAGGGDQLMTAHVEPEFSPLEQFPGDPWLQLNQTYTYEIVHRHLQADYERLPVRPFVLFESTYEGEHNASQLQVRRQAYWALLSGACGQFLGNFPVWLMPPGYEPALDSPGARAMERLAELFSGRRWWELVPDANHTIVTAGLGEFRGLDYCTAAATPDGELALAYVPAVRPITVDLPRLRQHLIRTTWINPATGERTPGQIRTARVAQVFEPPFDEDAVLLIEGLSRAGS
jgi:hypothetical protein